MVDGSIDLSVAPEINRTGGDNLRRRSMGKASSFNIDEHNIPHHRRTSVGSCHDFCKYGNKHSLETKARYPLLKTARKKSLDGQNSDHVVSLPEREETTGPVAKLKASPNSETCIADGTDTMKLEVPINSPSKQSPAEIDVVNECKKLVVKTKTLPHLKNHKHKTSETTQQVVFPLKKSEISPKQALKNSEEMIFPKKLDSSLKAKTLKVKSMISPGPSGSTAVHRNNNSKLGKGARTSKGIEMKVVVNPTVLLVPKAVDAVANLPAIKNKNMKVVSSLKSQNRTRRAQTKEAPNVEVQEKTLYIIDMETKNKLSESEKNEKPPSSPYKPSTVPDCLPSSPHREDRYESEYTRNEVDASFSESNKLDSIKKEEATNGNKKGRFLRMLQPKGKDSSSLKLNFRKGKVLDLHSENHSPRRLKFRRGRSPGDNQKSKDGQRISFKEVVINEISKDSIPPSEKVVLRRQDVQGKKNTQMLLNNVIEETASKLVRTRKSKVKALVGAFETVISLQDKKPSLKSIA